MMETPQAPGWPGIDPRWTSSAKTGIGTALQRDSRVWFTLSHGILNEIYYPRVDQACTRDLGLIVTDGQDFFSEEKRHAHHETAWLAGEVSLSEDGGAFLLALGFGATSAEAAREAAASLADGFESARSRYVEAWQAWQESLTPLPGRGAGSGGQEAISAAVLRTCESKEQTGGIVASLSLPWGSAKGDADLGGYHLVWPRDLVETAGALVAIGAGEDVRRVLKFLASTQAEDGHWPQNMWIDGTPYWSGVQLDETAFPILLVDLMRRKKLLEPGELAQVWPMVRRAAEFLVVHGPVTLQDRWEEDPGYSPFTLAATVAALLASATLADANGERATGFVPIKNRPPGQGSEPATQIISPDALALVRFGLRAADDPRIVNTVRVIDALLEVDTPNGPTWHRYNDDGYGEHADGAPFDGVGIGRPWPLLTGERAHYELAAGRTEHALRLLDAMDAFANEGGLLPEQVWDSPDIPERELFLGRPSGSAMPLVWAHAERIKLRRSLQDKRLFDLPPQTVRRYQVDHRTSPYFPWRFHHKCRSMPAGKVLRVETLAPARLRWSTDRWRTAQDWESRDSGIALHGVDLPTAELLVGSEILFTFYWPQGERWEGTDFAVEVTEPILGSELQG